MDGWPPRGLAAPLHTGEANTYLHEGGYRLSLESVASGGFKLVGDGAGSGVPIQANARWADLYGALVRMRRTRQQYDPRSLTDLVRWLDASPICELPQRSTHKAGWRALCSAVESDPVLRMHCATLSPSPIAAGVEPSPSHPSYPGGTVVAGLPALLCSRPYGLLAHMIVNRFERSEDELSYFLDFFIRPLIRTFRLAADTHRIGLFSLHDRGVGFELSPELEPTGRIVITDQTGVQEITSASSDEVARGVETLLATLDALSAAFSLIEFELSTYPESRVRAAVDRVIADELRFLDPRTAEVFSGDHPLRSFVHAVSSEQDEALKNVLHTVQERARKRRWDPELPQPVVVIDLDLCGLVPLQRTLEATRAIAGPRPGAPGGILELAKPTGLPVLPTYVESTWHAFLEVSGLGTKYPRVDWRAVYGEFFRAFARPWERLRTDTVNPGLPRFVWDVQDAGGQVVFCTGRREWFRHYTEDVLKAAGVPGAVLVCMPDVRTRPISELKVEKLRELGFLDVVAVFDDLLENRIALSKEFPDARAIAVEIPGMATERLPDQPVPDQVPVISTFETSPRRPVRCAGAGARLSNTHSLEELQVGALRRTRLTKLWPVRLSTGETLSIVDTIVADADRSAQRTARSAQSKLGPGDGSRDHLIRLLHHLFTRKQFLKGSRSHYQSGDMHRDVAAFLDQQRPIEVVLLGFPVKQCLSRLKAFGPLPDLAELGALVRLRELQQAVRAVYPPGLRFNILTDGRHFRPRPSAVTGAYSRKLKEYATLIGIDDDTVIDDIDAVAAARLSPEVPARRAARLTRYRRLLNEVLRGYDITDNPLRTLEEITELTVDGPDGQALRQALGMFREMLMSMVYSVPVSPTAGIDRITWSSLVYADVYNLTGDGVSPELRQARSAVLRRSWHNVIRYLATMQVDEELGYDSMFSSRVRLTVSAARPGRCGFTYLGGSGLLPWQGTGVVDGRGHVAADFAISLLDQGFVPVYSDLLGPRQPWMMVPAGKTMLTGRTATSPPALHLDEEFTSRIRLRRK